MPSVRSDVENEVYRETLWSTSAAGIFVTTLNKPSEGFSDAFLLSQFIINSPS